MTRKTLAEQIQENLDNIERKNEEVKQLKNKGRTLLNKQRGEERKARTNRLIQRGAILESVHPALVTLPNDQLQALLYDLFRNPEVVERLEATVAVPTEGESLEKQGRTYTP